MTAGFKRVRLLATGTSCKARSDEMSRSIFAIPRRFTIEQVETGEYQNSRLKAYVMDLNTIKGGPLRKFKLAHCILRKLNRGGLLVTQTKVLKMIIRNEDQETLVLTITFGMGSGAMGIINFHLLAKTLTTTPIQVLVSFNTLKLPKP